jgi:FRG domain
MQGLNYPEGDNGIRNTLVSSWNELSDTLHTLAENTALQRLRSRYVYRGMPEAGLGLVTSLTQLDGPYHELESAILASFRKYAHVGLGTQSSYWNWLALAQHHGLPTRLLDWTYSPYVALHFVTDRCDRFDTDGVIWCIDRKAMHHWLPDRLKKRLATETAEVFTAEMLEQEAATLREFDTLGAEPFGAFFEPPSLDERIVNQFAQFSLLSDPRLRLDQWLMQRPAIAQRLIIPARLKWEIRDRLDEANVTERVLFPGLDGLCRWLTRYYMPRTRAE